MNDETRVPPKKNARRRRRPGAATPAATSVDAAPPATPSKGPSPAPGAVPEATAARPARKRVRKPAAAKRGDAPTARHAVDGNPADGPQGTDAAAARGAVEAGPDAAAADAAARHIGEPQSSAAQAAIASVAAHGGSEAGAEADSRSPARSDAPPVAAADRSARSAPAGPSRAESGPDAPLLRTRLDVRWGDMDAFNHVNNARFLSYLEEARLRWLQGLSGPWLDDDTAPVLAAANVNFRRPIEWPCTLAIELRAERSGRSSLTLAHRIVDATDPDVLYSDGNVVMVWIDRRSGKPSVLPRAVREACG